MRNSTFLGNTLNGIHIVTSSTGADDVLEDRIDLGTGTGATGDVRGRNTLQVAATPTAGNRNGGAGLCIGALTAGAPTGQTLDAQANLFAGATTGTRDCGTAGAGAITVEDTCTGYADLGIPATSPATVATNYCTQ